MGTQKWHALDHFAYTLEGLGDIQFAPAGFYEALHKMFKRNFGESSRRRRSVMHELARGENYFLEYQYWFSNHSSKSFKVSASLSEAAKED